MLTKVLMPLIASVIPAFFLLVYLSSTYHRLAAARAAYKEAEAALKGNGGTGSDSIRFHGDGHSSAAKVEYLRAATAYNALRNTIPTRWIAPLFGFRPAKPQLTSEDISLPA
jgi:hypothetical protein